MTEAIRAAVRFRANDCCEYCRAQAAFSHDPFSIEHIIPLAKGGTDDQENLAWSCLGCNNYKFTFTEAFDLVTAQLTPLFNPRTDSWDAHFRWSRGFTWMIGLTPVGRATVLRMQLNRPGLVNLRKVLVAVSKHPPQ